VDEWFEKPAGKHLNAREAKKRWIIVSLYADND
jgi:hypothetical protein